MLEHSFQGHLLLPHFIYHGTLTKFVPSFRDRVLDNSWWAKTDRDFGCAFYTTISLEQAKDWALRAVKKSGDPLAEAAVIKIRIDPQIYAGHSNCLVFIGDTNPNWCRFIVDHRLECTEDDQDPCGHGKHPAIIVGQMADNKMDLVHKEFQALGTNVPIDKYAWYYEKITQNKEGTSLDALELGNQIAFCDPGMNEMFSLTSYYILDEAGEEWIEYDRDVDPV